MNEQLLKAKRNLKNLKFKTNLHAEQFRIESWPANMARMTV